jgi:predicted outer membrane repeat protein
MQLFTWLIKRMSGRTHTRSRPVRKPTPRFRPQLEVLEGRDVPSTLTVTNIQDSGPGSLRADIAAASSGDTINFDPALDGQTITLTSGQLVINKNLTIQGPGAGQLAISGGNTSRVFEMYGNTNPNVLLSGLTITQGRAPQGGGIYNTPGASLTISGCTLSDNRAGDGGGVYNFGATLTIVNSTLSGNQANDPSGYEKGGAVYSAGFTHTVSITGCTFSNNSAGVYGGAIWTVSTNMTITSCSFSGNVEYGGNPAYPSLYRGNDIYNASGASMLKVSYSVFSNNTPYLFAPIVGGWTNNGHNTFNY